MSHRLWIGAAAVVLSMGIHSASADTLTSEGYSLEDYHLKTARDLVDICTLEESHADHTTAMSFCYGFFEGAIHYHDVVKGMAGYVEMVCDPEDNTRTDAVREFTSFINANPQYGSELPIDAVVRALSARWPCSES